LSKGSYWTLAGCWLTRSSSNDGEEFYVEYALAGPVGLDEADLSALDEIRIGFEGTWSMVPSEPRGARQLNRPPVSLAAQVADGLTVELVSELVDLESTEEDAFAFRDRLIFVGKTATPMSFRDLHSAVVGPLHDLLTLVRQRGATVNFCEVSGPGTTITTRARERRERVAVYWNRVGNTDTDDERPSTPVLQIPTAPDHFQDFMSAWFDNHARLALPIGLRTADLVAPMTFAPTRFLLVAQALEALHRRLYPDARNEPGIKARLAVFATVDESHRKVVETLLLHAHEPTFRQRDRWTTTPGCGRRHRRGPQCGHALGPRQR
jgi:hypothetical protein